MKLLSEMASVPSDINVTGVKEDVQAILSSAIRADENQENTSFYSNGLDGMDDESVISNRQRLNETHPPSRDIGQHLASNYQAPSEHLMSEAMK